MARPFVKKMKRIAAWGFGVLVTALAVLITLTVGWRPVLGARSRPLINLKVYLAEEKTREP